MKGLKLINLKAFIKKLRLLYKLLSYIDLHNTSENHQATVRSNVKALGYQYARSLLKNLSPPDNLSAVNVGLASKACQQEDIESAWFAYWCQQMQVPIVYHRKMWEFCYILQVLYDYDLLKSGVRGLGFGCGEEPLPSLLAAYDIEITATDLNPQESSAKGWLDTNQNASSIEKIWNSKLCGRELFEKNVSLRYVDMNAIPPDLENSYDFCWSACALEHLGSIDNGLRFIEESIKTLVPSGVCIHTTEFNYLQEDKTVDNCGTVLFRKRDFIKLVQNLTSQGHQVVPLNFEIGDGFLDQFIDIPPYETTQDAHLKLLVDDFATTSFGIIVKRCS
jgi:SAM-dependent methyltransferase